MRGASRASFAALNEQLAAEDITSATVATRLGNELFAVVGLLDREHALRRALADPGKPAAEKGAVAGALLHGKVTQRTEALVVTAVEGHWASPGDMVDAIEELAVSAMVLAADADGSLDDLEDELFRFSRVVSGSRTCAPRWPIPACPTTASATCSAPCSTARWVPSTLTLITQVVEHPRGRPLERALDMCAGIAARRREQLIAVVRSAVELSAAQRRRLAEALSASYGHKIHLNVVLDPSVVGGMSVQIGDELIDGTAASRLAEVRRKLAG